MKFNNGNYRFKKEIEKGKFDGTSILYYSNGQQKFSCKFK